MRVIASVHELRLLREVIVSLNDEEGRWAVRKQKLRVFVGVLIEM
jgi:hypothetical protein